MQDERLQAVLPDGTVTGDIGRIDAHRAPGVLHNAFSLVIVDNQGRVLIQQRHIGKPTFAGHWSNSVCSHPFPGESLIEATKRRTFTELGIEIEPVEVGSFVYRADDPDSEYAEHELDHVMVAFVEEPRSLTVDPQEIDDVAWIDAANVDAWISDPKVPTTPWFPLVHRISQSYLASLGH